MEKIEGMDGIFHFHSLFLFLENRTPIGIFNSSRGLRHGDPVSSLPCIFLKTLSKWALIRMPFSSFCVLDFLNDMISRFVRLLFYFSFSTSFV